MEKSTQTRYTYQNLVYRFEKTHRSDKPIRIRDIRGIREWEKRAKSTHNNLTLTLIAACISYESLTWLAISCGKELGKSWWRRKSERTEQDLILLAVIQSDYRFTVLRTKGRCGTRIESNQFGVLHSAYQGIVSQWRFVIPCIYLIELTRMFGDVLVRQIISKS